MDGVEESNPCSQLGTDPSISTMESLQEWPGKDSGYVPETSESHLVETCGDSVDGGATSGPSPAVDDGARGGEGKCADLIVEERDSVAEVSDSQPGGGNMESEPANLVGVAGERDSDSGDVAEDKKGAFNEDELPLLGFPDAGVDEGGVLTGGEQREQAELGDGERMTDGEGNQIPERELGQRTASEQTQEADAMSEETIAQSNIVDERETPPEDKELAGVSGFTEILSQDKGSGGTGHRSGCQHGEKEPSQEVLANEGAKGVSDGEAREEVDAKEDILDGQCVQVAETETGARIEEERKGDAVEREDVAVVENEDKPVDVVASEVAEEKESSVDGLSADVAQFAGETGNQLEILTVDVEEVVDKKAEAGKSENMQMAEPPEEVETCAKDEVEIKEEGNSAKNEVGAEEEGCGEDKVGRGEETNGMAGVKAAEKSEEEVKVDEKKNTQAAEETERTGDEGQEEDNHMVDEAEDMETLGDSSVADVSEGRENLVVEMGIAEPAETQEETVMAEAGEEEPEGVEDGEEENKTSGEKRKRGRNSKGSKGSGKKKEEDVCFICFDGGDLILCDRR